VKRMKFFEFSLSGFIAFCHLTIEVLLLDSTNRHLRAPARVIADCLSMKKEFNIVSKALLIIIHAIVIGQLGIALDDLQSYKRAAFTEGFFVIMKGGDVVVRIGLKFTLNDVK